jgi:uncharacterized protein (TIGR03435 family)
MTRYVLAGVFAAGMILAQAPDLPSFEAASVRPASSERQTGGSSTINNGSIVVRNVPLRACIADAFGVRRADVIGPAWIDSARFDIVAKASTSDPSTPTLKMYQALLIERFHLRVHAGTRSEAGFELSAVKGGIRLRDIGPRLADDEVFPANMRSNASHIVSSRGMTMGQLARQLSQRLGGGLR